MFKYLFLLITTTLSAQVVPGIENLFLSEHKELLRNKKVALLTNHTGVTRSLKPTHKLIQEHEPDLNLRLTAIFTPEHGLYGAKTAGEKVEGETHNSKITIHSLHGKHRRPTREMLKNIDVILVDIQDIGSRSYTYVSTVFYVMEEAQKANIPVIIADRPHPIHGLMVDGLMLEPQWRSFVGYVNTPYCHGMTIGELAQYFNREYKIGCALTVVPMKGWKRWMTYTDTELPWVPTSPNIPEPTTTFFYPLTGILGELQFINIGIGYTLPFKIMGAPWIDGEKLASNLQKQQLPGVQFTPFHFTPASGMFQGEECNGVLVIVQDHQKFLPVTTQYTILGLLKSLYPKEFKHALGKHKNVQMFHKVNGSEKPYKILETNPYPAWSLRELDTKERKTFLKTRKKYLIENYS